MEGSAVDRQLDGAVMLVVLAGIMLVTALVSASITGLEARGRVRLGTLRHARRLAVAAVAVGALCACGLVAGGLRERGDASPKASANPARLASVTSRRYEYWRVGATAFERDPVRGVGAAGFRVVWLMDRQVTGGALEAHSLVVEAAAELGIPGLLLLFMFLGGIAMAARRALRQDAELAAGGCAACSVWLLHATIDWDWQLPAVTLPALVLAGGLLALSESQPPAGGWAGARAGAGPRAGSRGLGGLGRTPRRRPAASGERAAVTWLPVRLRDRQLAARAALATLAILLIAWFAVLARNARIGSAAADRIDGELSDAGWKRSLDDFRRAELLDPGTEWRAMSANYLLLRDNRAALRMARSVVEEEPDNLDGWSVVYRASRRLHRRDASQALAQLQRLNPAPTEALPRAPEPRLPRR